MKTIPTAEEFCNDLQSEYEETGEYKMYFAIDIPNKLKEFAKLHVEAALTEAFKTAKWKEQITMQGLQVTIIKGSILNAYPLTNIK